MNQSHAGMAALDQQRRELIVRFCRGWDAPENALDVPLIRNPRLTRAVARFRRDRRVIELGPRFFELRARRSEVLCHELAYIAVDFVHGRKAKSHGPEWRRPVELAGFRPAARMPRAEPVDAPGSPTAESRRPATHSYRHYCPVCHMVRLAKRPVTRWRCAACVAAGLPGTLQITRTPAK